MPVRNESQVAYLDQSEIDSGDIVIWEKPPAGYWVVSGGIVTAQGTADGTVAVSAGTGRVGGSNKTISAGNVSVLTGSANPDGTTAAASDATLARIDLIVLNGSSQLGVLHGTPAGLSPNNDGSYLCEFPSAVNYLVLASVFISPNATVVTTSMIESKRIVGSVDAFHDQAHSQAGANHTGGLSAAQLQTAAFWTAKGQLALASANATAATLSPPTQRKQVLGADEAGNVAWQPMQSGPTGYRINEEFIGLNTGFAVATTSTPVIGPFQGSLSGTASAISPSAIAATASHQGVISLDTGTTTTGRTYLGTSLTAMRFGDGRMRCGAWVYPPVLSDGTHRFEVTVGFLDGFSTATIVDGAFFSYRDNLNSGNWQATTSSNSVTTATVTGSTVAASTSAWAFLEVEVNAAGTSATYYVNKTLVATHAANIPTGAGRECGFGVSILKSVGTTSRSVNIDAMFLEADFTTAR